MFSKKLQYGLRFLLLLRGSEGLKYIGVAELSEQEKMPRKFVEAIAVALKKAGLVEVKRGANGGYRLVRPLSSISLLDVWQVLDPSEEEAPVDGGTVRQKVVDGFLLDVASQYQAMLGSITLDQLEGLLLKENDKMMYYI